MKSTAMRNSYGRMDAGADDGECLGCVCASIPLPTIPPPAPRPPPLCQRRCEVTCVTSLQLCGNYGRRTGRYERHGVAICRQASLAPKPPLLCSSCLLIHSAFTSHSLCLRFSFTLLLQLLRQLRFAVACRHHPCFRRQSACARAAVEQQAGVRCK